MVDEDIFRILLVDDEAVIRDLVKAMLSSSTVQVDAVADGAACLKAAKARHFDLILLDIVLPGMDGVAICRMLKHDPATANIPVFMVTAKVKQSDIETSINAGAAGYINKPFKSADLMRLIELVQKNNSTR